MAVSHRSSISLGMVHSFGVLYTAIKDNDINFNQFCNVYGCVVKYIRSVFKEIREDKVTKERRCI